MSTAKAKKMQQASSGVALALNPIKGYRDELRRKGIDPKNHQKDNVLRLRELQKYNREKKIEAERPKEQFVLKEFKDVPSRVFGDVGIKVHKTESPAKVVEEKRSVPPVPKRNELAKLKSRDHKNFLKLNIKKVAVKTTTKKKPEEKQVYRDQGKVPLYLQHRKIQLAMQAEKKRLASLTPDVPPGLVMLSEEERLNTLNMLNEGYKKFEEQLRRLPLHVETFGQVEKQKKIEGRMIEVNHNWLEKLHIIEDALKLFNKPVVYVQTED